MLRAIECKSFGAGGGMKTVARLRSSNSMATSRTKTPTACSIQTTNANPAAWQQLRDANAKQREQRETQQEREVRRARANQRLFQDEDREGAGHEGKTDDESSISGDRNGRGSPRQDAGGASQYCEGRVQRHLPPPCCATPGYDQSSAEEPVRGDEEGRCDESCGDRHGRTHPERRTGCGRSGEADAEQAEQCSSQDQLRGSLPERSGIAGHQRVPIRRAGAAA